MLKINEKVESQPREQRNSALAGGCPWYYVNVYWQLFSSGTQLLKYIKDTRAISETSKFPCFALTIMKRLWKRSE